MATTRVSRQIEAPQGEVFAAVADIRNFSQAIPHIVDVRFLSEVQVGVGARFVETRDMQGRKAETELEVTEYVENERVRLVADSHGTVWDTLFTVHPEGNAVRLDMTMEARAYRLLPKLINPWIKGMVQKAVEKDLDAVKAYCERSRPKMP